MYNRFFIYRSGKLKDIIQCIPTIQALKNGYPDSEITWGTHPYYVPLLECNLNIDNVIPISLSNIFSVNPQLKRHYKAAIDLQGDPLSGYIISKIKAKNKYSHYTCSKIAGLFSEKILPDSTSLHIVDQYVDIARSAGGKMHEAEFALEPLNKDLTNMKIRLRQLNILGPFILIDPTPPFSNEIWNIQNYIKLSKTLADQGIVCILTGKNNEYNHFIYQYLIENKLLNVYSFIGKTSLPELLALVSLSSACVGQDNAIIHLAAALKVPAIGLYSTTRPEKCCPYGQLSRCFFDKNNINRIPVESIIQTINTTLVRVY